MLRQALNDALRRRHAETTDPAERALIEELWSAKAAGDEARAMKAFADYNAHYKAVHSKQEDTTNQSTG